MLQEVAELGVGGDAVYFEVELVFGGLGEEVAEGQLGEIGGVKHAPLQDLDVDGPPLKELVGRPLPPSHLIGKFALEVDLGLELLVLEEGAQHQLVALEKEEGLEA